MTERTKPKAPEAFAEELGVHFPGIWQDGDGREGLRSDLEKIGPEGMVGEFRRAAELFGGLHDMAEQTFGFGAYLVFGEAKRHAERARAVAEKFAQSRPA